MPEQPRQKALGAWNNGKSIGMYSKQKFDLFSGGTLVFAICLAAIVIIGTPWGLGLNPDSVSYKLSARALVDRGDIMHLPSNWPPLYPILLALAQLLANDLDLGARLLQGLFIGVNIVLIAMLLKRTDQPHVSIVTLLILIPLQPDFMNVHLWLCSEPAFLILALLNLLILETTFRRGNSRSLLLSLGLVAGMAITVRYAGMFLLAVNVVALVFLDRNERSIVARIRDAVSVSAVAVIPISIWALFNVMRSENATSSSVAWHPLGESRSLAWHPLDEQHIRQAIATIGEWFHLSAKPGILAVVLISGTAIWALRTTKSISGNAPQILPRLLSIYCFAYAAFLVLSISVADFHTPLDKRILFPLLPVIPMLLVCAAKEMTKYPFLQLMVTAAVVLGFALNVPESYSLWRESRVNGNGFASKKVQAMPIITRLKQLPEHLRISTNGPEYFLLYLKRGASFLPKRLDPNSQKFNPNYIAELQQLPVKADAIVYFSEITWRYYLPERNELAQVEGFEQVYDQTDGAILIRVH